MWVEDKKGSKWKVTIDEEHKVHFYNQGKACLEVRVGFPAEKLSDYYKLQEKEKANFLHWLGRRIGMPMWPLFIQRGMDKEIELFSSLGVLGKNGEHGDDAGSSGYWEFIVPECREEAMDRKPSLQPTSEELSEHEKRLNTVRSRIAEEGIAAVSIRILPDKEETVKCMDRATELIQICAVCSCPADQVGVFSAEEGSDRVVLHGMCPECAPRSEGDEDKVQAMQNAVRDLLQRGQVKTWTNAEH